MSPIYVPGKVVLAKEPFRAIAATGGDSVSDITVGGIRYRVHTFTTVGTSTFTVTDPGSGLHPGIGGQLNGIEYLIIAGGGGGGRGIPGSNNSGGGGGAGGYRCSVAGEQSGGGSAAESLFIPSLQTYGVVVGAGGFGLGSGVDTTKSYPGGDSSFASIASTGGGGGARTDNNSTDRGTGGSGGGGNYTSSATGQCGGFSGTANQGFAGGRNIVNNGGGGGGAGGCGWAGGDSGNPKLGGLGLASAITGASILRASGGIGSSSNNAAPDNTTVGGGGGAKLSPTAGQNGLSGIVIVRYAI